jgi:hypothetical protein
MSKLTPLVDEDASFVSGHLEYEYTDSKVQICNIFGASLKAWLTFTRSSISYCALLGEDRCFVFTRSTTCKGFWGSSDKIKARPERANLVNDLRTSILKPHKQWFQFRLQES